MIKGEPKIVAREVIREKGLPPVKAYFLDFSSIPGGYKNLIDSLWKSTCVVKVEDRKPETIVASVYGFKEGDESVSGASMEILYGNSSNHDNKMWRGCSYENGIPKGHLRCAKEMGIFDREAELYARYNGILDSSFDVLHVFNRVFAVPTDLNPDDIQEGDYLVFDDLENGTQEREKIEAIGKMGSGKMFVTGEESRNFEDLKEKAEKENLIFSFEKQKYTLKQVHPEAFF